MPVAEKDLILLAQWFVSEVGPRLSRWIDREGVRPSTRAVQARANRARAIGEVDNHVHAYLIMSTDQALRWCWAEGIGVSTRAWVKADGEVAMAPGGHDQWITENMDSLVADGLAPGDPAQRTPRTVANNLMLAHGWISYSGGQVLSPMGMPNAAQIPALEDLIHRAGAPEGFDIDLIIGKAFHSVSSKQVAEQGLTQVLASLPKLARRADFGGGSDGPSQQGDGQEVGRNFMETVQDGSTAPFERSYRYMKQDFEPEVWWSRQLLDYLKKNFPGKKDVSGPEPDSGSIPSATGPGQQFANSVRTVLEASKRVADATDPSDTDGQHDQLNEDSMSTHLLDPGSILYKRQKGRGAPAGDPSGAGDGEMHTRLGGDQGPTHVPTPNPHAQDSKIGRFMREPRPYKCTLCGHEKQISTNHLGNVMDHCSGCSWKSEGFGPGARIFPGQPIYREFAYVGPDIDPQAMPRAVHLNSFKDRWFVRLSDKALEQQIIQMEKDHLEPREIKQELRQEGIPPRVIGETYDQRDKNLIKTVEVTI